MKLVVFGLTVSSSWGNGHATLWRALCRALARRGHEVVFFERDVPYYAMHRDLTELPRGRLVLYTNWRDVLPLAARELADCDAGMVTSYCPDAIRATELLVCSSAPTRIFYDLDTPVTLSHLRAGDAVPYIGERGLRDFDLVLSYTGGGALGELTQRLGARRVAPLYGSVDPEVHRPVPPSEAYRCHLSYLGTYAADRQAGVEALFVEPARQLPEQRFLLGGAQYPASFPWAENIFFLPHVAPPAHSAFYCSSALTLNVTRRVMAESGFCPSGRLFEAAACGVPILTDWWPGLDTFFEPGSELFVAHGTDDAIAALNAPPSQLAAVARAAREHTLHAHTADHRAAELESALGTLPRQSTALAGGAWAHAPQPGELDRRASPALAL